MSHELPAVAGRLAIPLWELQQRCLVLIGEEQQKPNPDNALIGALCDCVRLVREAGGEAEPDHRAPHEKFNDAVILAEIREALTNEGPRPMFHRFTMSRHRAEWPTLWAALDRVLLAAGYKPPPPVMDLMRALTTSLKAQEAERDEKKMVILMEPTRTKTNLDGVPCRIWEGKTREGVTVYCFVARIAVPVDADQEAFQAALDAVEPKPLAINLRMIL